MTDAHNPKLLSDADMAADLAGLPRPVSTDAVLKMARAYSQSADRIERLDRLLEADVEAWKVKQYRATADTFRALVSERDALAVRVSELEGDEHKPLFGEMIAQHPGLREEIAAELVEQDERAAFEAAYRARYPVSCDLDPAKFNRSDVGDYEDIRVSIAWAMWQARASKGTP